jgi:hypothetical protein
MSDELNRVVTETVKRRTGLVILGVVIVAVAALYWLVQRLSALGYDGY